MSPIAKRIARACPVILLPVLISLPRAFGDDPTSRQTASQATTSQPASTSQPSDLEIELREGRRMIEETAAVYKNCKSYQDEGEVVTVFFRDKDKRIDRKPFKTAFFRADRFRFEYRDPDFDPGQYIVWANQTDVRSWWHVQPGVEEHNTLSDTLARATGVSGGSAHTIPVLLLPSEIGGRSLKRLQKIRFTDQEKSRGVLYDILDGINPQGNPVRIWIDADTKLICKILTKKKYPRFRTEETTTYKPRINIEIPGKDLEFNPPQE